MASAAWFSTEELAEAPVSPTSMGGLLGEAAAGVLLRVPSAAAPAECAPAGGLRGEAEEEEGERGGIGRAKRGLRCRWSSICNCIGICKGCVASDSDKNRHFVLKEERKEGRRKSLFFAFVFFWANLISVLSYCSSFLAFLPFIILTIFILLLSI